MCAGADASATGDADGTFTDPKQRYRLQTPAGWTQTSKAGADALFQDPNQKGTTLGVTVTPVRIASLEQFGSVDSVGEKLLSAERAKVR